jgi:hypothetical protein
MGLVELSKKEAKLRSPTAENQSPLGNKRDLIFCPAHIQPWIISTTMAKCRLID